MKVEISKLMEHYIDDEFAPREGDYVDAGAVRDRVMAQLPSAPKRRRAGRPVRTVLIAAAVCAALLVSAVAVSPALREQMAAFLGDFSDYVQPVEPSSDTWDGIRLTAVSAMMDDHVLKVYVEAKDLEGDRLAPMATAEEHIAVADTNLTREEPSSYTSACRCISYDTTTSTALLEFALQGDYSGVTDTLEFNLYVDELYPEGWLSWRFDDGPIITNPDQNEDTNWTTWTLPLTVERLEVDTYQLDQTIDGTTQLLTLELSAASATLKYTVPEEDRKSSPADDTNITLYLSDGSTVQGTCSRRSGIPNNWVLEETKHYVHGYLDGETEYTTWTAPYQFEEPLDIKDVVAIHIQHWYIPLNTDGTTGEAQWGARPQS